MSRPWITRFSSRSACHVVIHIVRDSRAASVVTETMAGHRPSIWVSDLYGAQQGHADLWQVCLAHQLRDCKYAIEASDMIFAPRMKALLLRAVVLARRRKHLAESTRRTYQSRLDRELDAIMVLAPTNQHGSGCESVTARCEVTCSLFSNIPMPPRSASVPNGEPICSLAFDPSLGQRRDGERMRIRRF